MQGNGKGELGARGDLRSSCVTLAGAAEEARTKRLPRGIESGGLHLDPKKRTAMAWDLQKKQQLFQ